MSRQSFLLKLEPSAAALSLPDVLGVQRRECAAHGAFRMITQDGKSVYRSVTTGEYIDQIIRRFQHNQIKIRMHGRGSKIIRLNSGHKACNCNQIEAHFASFSVDTPRLETALLPRQREIMKYDRRTMTGNSRTANRSFGSAHARDAVWLSFLRTPLKAPRHSGAASSGASILRSP